MPTDDRNRRRLEQNIQRLEGLREQVRRNPGLANALETSITTLRHLLDTERRLHP